MKSGQINPINKYYSKELRNLIEVMLSVKSQNRPNISQIFEKDFIRNHICDYLKDTINSNDISEEEIKILKDQAFKLGLLDYLTKLLETENENISCLLSSGDKINSELECENNKNEFEDDYLNSIKLMKEKFIILNSSKIYDNMINFFQINHKKNIDDETVNYYNSLIKESNDGKSILKPNVFTLNYIRQIIFLNTFISNYK